MKRLKEGGHSVTDHGDLVSSFINEYYDECNDEYYDALYDEYIREAVMREKCSFFEHCSKGL